MPHSQGLSNNSYPEPKAYITTKRSSLILDSISNYEGWDSQELSNYLYPAPN